MPPPAQEPPHASVDVPASMHVVQASNAMEQQHSTFTALKAIAKRFFCRLDVCGTLVFFLFLVVAATASTAPTQNYVFKALQSSWDDTHATKVANTAAVYERLAGRMYRLASSSMSLRSNTPYDMDNERTLATLCATLARYDTTMRFMSFSVWSPNLGATTGCMHGDPQMPSLRTLTGYITGESGINGTYLVDPRTFLFQRPHVQTSTFTISRESVMERVHSIYTSTPLFEAAERYYNGSIDSIDPRTMWTPDPPAPHLLFFNLPAALLLRGLNINVGPNISSFLRLALNGLTLAKSTHFPLQAGEKLAVFINASLSDEDPLIMSNSWGETELVKDASLFDNLEHLPLPYLRSSSVSDPLMRTALKHVNFKALRTDGSRKATIFRYKGAFATVTAWNYITTKGLTVPFVYVSPQIAILPPHLLYAQVVTGLLVAAILVLSALYWSYLHFRFTRPLRRMSELLHRSVATGQRVMFRQERHFFFRNTEVEEVVAAHNSCMRRLREIDSFVPRCLRASPTGSVGGDSAAAQPTRDSIFRGAAAEAESSAATHPTLMPQQSTVVTVTVRPRPAAQQAPAAIAVRVAQWRAHRASSPAQLLDRVVATAASASNMVNSGPFPTPAALEAFASAVNDLAERHHGTTLRFAPDGCVVHFGAAVRTHLLSAAVAAAQAAPGRRADRTPEECLHAAVVRRRAVACGRRDAADAVAFALALQAWVDQRRRTRMPDVRLLLDTSTFVCGLYRNEWSGQVIPVALGRDVHREVGHVPAALGVRVAMTEETANLVRARVCGSNTRKLEAGVRQLPVEALRTGRVGLNADVVILYEVLPGSVAGCAPWQRYQRCCFDGFGFMVHGEYAAALGAFKQVADIADLEPGLVPSSLRREAASSAVVGGAVSVQVQRLMNECELRVRAGATDGFRRTRLCPLGIDTVLRGLDYDPRQSTPHRPPAAQASAHTTTTTTAGAAAYPARAVREEGPCSPAFRTPDFRVERAVLTAHRADGTATRYVLGGKPERVEDNHGCFWCVPTSPNHMLWADPWNTAVPVLGSAGVLCTMTVMPLSETPAEVAAALRGVPDGAMSDAVRRAVPLCVPTPRMRAAAERLYIKQQAIPHPNLLAPLAYSFSLEGALALVTECQPGGTLRALCHRYGALRPLTMARFTVDILAGLAGLHSLGLAHGALSLDNVVVGDAGVCRLRHHFLHSRQSAQLLRVPATVYVSPATAAGQPPTPACDIFCYGLLCIEAAGRQPCWRWADTEEGVGCDGDAAARAKALRELLRRAGQPFHDAVVQRRVVPAVEALRTPTGMRYLTVADRDTLRRCFSYDAAERPTAAQLRHVSLGILARHGFGEVPNELWEANT